MKSTSKTESIFSKGLELSTAPKGSMSELIDKLDEEVAKNGFSLSGVRVDRLDPSKHIGKLKSV